MTDEAEAIMVINTKFSLCSCSSSTVTVSLLFYYPTLTIFTCGNYFSCSASLNLDLRGGDLLFKTFYAASVAAVIF